MEAAEKYIVIEDAGASPSGKTGRWTIRNIRTNEICGTIKYHVAFWSYCFWPSDGFLFDASCLRLISDFLKTRNEAHRKK